MSAPSEPAWKRWLDRRLMVNVLLVFIGAGVFAVAVVQQGQVHDWLMDQVQLLWQPLFAPKRYGCHSLRRHRTPWGRAGAVGLRRMLL